MKKILFIFIALCFGMNLQAQQEVHYAHYDFNSLVFNPAYAGMKRTLSVNALSRIQWAGFDGAPVYHNVSVHSPLYGNLAGGLTFLTGTIGPVKETQIFGDVAYHVPITDKLRFSMAVRGGIFNTQRSLSTLKTTSADDPGFINTDYSLTLPQTGFGLYLYNEKSFLCFSAPRIVIASNAADNAYLAKTNYFFVAGRIFPVNEVLTLKSTVLIKTVAGAPAQADLNLHAILFDKFSIGAFYRSEAALGVLLNVWIKDNINFVYAYEYSTGAVEKYNDGTHEIGLQWIVPYTNKSSIKCPRYF